ncbi:UNKNOWN [Stylonychia lemnae]|uniref:Uncharacterized protein n=1 Tax=Stylonychia lemnae TaxID=5949 RepID=A0A078AYV6_STYLE|nr:UNKNOWN [Stylonychia lemnae]|eukprot:CDW87625.1 UNKNOWN [Stylonychia lemnae]
MLQQFEGEDKNPYFEAVYMAQYHYYNAMISMEGKAKESAYLQHVIIILKKCLAVQLISYGKYHSSVFQTLQALGESQFKLKQKEEGLETLYLCREIMLRLNKKDELYELILEIKIAALNPNLKLDDAIKNLEEVKLKIDQLKVPYSEKIGLKIQVNNTIKDLAYTSNRKEISLKYLEYQLQLSGTGDIRYVQMKSNVLLDLSSISFDLGKYEDALRYAKDLQQLMKKSITLNQVDCEEFYNTAEIIIIETENILKLRQMSYLQQFRYNKPVLFYTVVGASIGILSFAAIKLIKNLKNN